VRRDGADQSLDVLSDVLRVVRLSGAIHFRGEFTRPWAFRTSTPEMSASNFNVREGSITPFHIFIDGSCWVTLSQFPPVRIETGDVIIFPRAGQHVMASDGDVEPVPISEIFPQPSLQRIVTACHGGGGERAQFICGFLHSDLQFDPLLRSLPSMLCIRERNDQLLLETMDDGGRRLEPVRRNGALEWWRASRRYLINEAAVPGPGNRAALARLTESLFVEVLRWQFQSAAAGHGGWLGGLHDPHIGRVLNLLHAHPDRAWTVNALAREAAVSRAVLARRFVALVGETPMQYLANWRMHLARHLLRDSTLGVSEIADRVGYDSDATFNRAFRRIVGSPPSAWRQAAAAVAGLPINDGGT
jgi:AraC family transcriptional regulator, alkane utilization regulator